MVKTPHQIEKISATLKLGEDRRVRLAPFASEDSRDRAPSVQRQTIDDPAEAVLRALAEPLNFPPLALAVVPGDRVALAVDASVPMIGQIVRGVLLSLQQANVAFDAISIVAANQESAALCRAGLSGDMCLNVAFVVHDPTNREELGLLGKTRQGDLLVNRAIFDADVVLPIGCARVDDFGVFDGLFPQLCDAESIDRYHLPVGSISVKQRSAMIRETNSAGEKIGTQIVVRIIPGPGNSIAEVVAGQAHAVGERCAALCRAQWMMEADRRASLVIATVTGLEESQTWQNIARALSVADRLVDAGGAVAVCSNLSRAPGKSLRRLMGASDLEHVERKILSDHGEDSWPAWELARALQRGPVYFLSQLDDETVEELGLAPVEGVEEIARLADRHQSCAVIDDSQYVVASVRGE